MRIKIIIGCSGSTFSFSQGQEVEVDEAMAQDLIKAQYAKELVQEPLMVTGTVNDNDEKAPEVTTTKTDEDEPPKNELPKDEPPKEDTPKDEPPEEDTPTKTPPKASNTKKTTKAKK